VSENHITLKNITMRFGSLTALDDVSIAVPKGKFLTLLGPSGCGKTTLLRVLAGFYRQDSGSIYVNGKDVGTLPPEKRDMPLVFQDYALFPHMTVAENIGYGLRLAKMRTAEINESVEKMLDKFGLKGTGKRFPGQLSGGQQQRVAFARAFIMRKGILLLDEPLSNLDAKLRVEVRAQLRRIQRQTGMTVIYVTHDQEEALAMSDIIAVMRQGKIQQFASPEIIYRRPATQFVADFIGGANLLPVVISENQVGKLKFPGINTKDTDTSCATAVIRPEYIRVCEPETGEFSGVVEESIFQGKLVQYSIRVGSRILFAEVFNAACQYPIGSQVGFCIDYENIHLIQKETEYNEQQTRHQH
jgi:ABC-type Fe3+/spermidine/putrescine transport system ATPase subunit